MEFRLEHDTMGEARGPAARINGAHRHSVRTKISRSARSDAGGDHPGFCRAGKVRGQDQ